MDYITAFFDLLPLFDSSQIYGSILFSQTPIARKLFVITL